MSIAGRDFLELIFDSLPYKAWAATSPIDAGKVQAEFNGIHRPSPSSKYAKGLVGLCRENPPEPQPPPPPPPSPLALVWRGDAVYTTALGNFDGLRRNPAKAAGFKTCYVQLLHAINGAANEQHLALMASEGWTLCGWGTYGQGTNPYEDGLAAAAIVRRLPVLRGWKANGEAWAEWQDAWKTDAFLRGWLDGGATVPLGWSVLSSDTANFARAYDYVSALRADGADIDIQVYGATHPTYTVSAGLGMLRNTPVPVERTTMTFDVTQTGIGPFGDYRTWMGPRRIWLGEWTTASTYANLAR